MIQFEWDPAKAKMNLMKHGIAFREAAKEKAFTRCVIALLHIFLKQATMFAKYRF